MTILATVNDVHILKLPSFVEAGSSLIVAESLAQIPHTISRAFFVTSQTEQIRGNHAHRTCNQTLICVSGAVEVIVNDGVNQRNITLDQPQKALSIPATIWAAQIYKEEPSILLVLCDKLFEESDYIRTHSDFIEWRMSHC